MKAGIAFLLAISVAAAVAQTANGTYTGCVTKDIDGNITFCEPQHCSLLTGDGVDASLAGHTVTVEGTVTAAGNGQPRTIVVSSVVSVGAACNQTCTLYPVHSRGIGPASNSVDGNKPGGQGGTPGAVSKPPQ